ncbi:hypothetical protein SAMN05421869_115189 [Nonomuraea jiangxiensis]|uniref:Uncharacterized protein n=1 Tax=Nonomuraea jiangxiensis TaxID=633440 RepID=A0A1G9B8I0_9ACTN|nr:hypothetical protein SAMN05421869_115189 [Nonomuraea jiangxiensis]
MTLRPTSKRRSSMFTVLARTDEVVLACGVLRSHGWALKAAMDRTAGAQAEGLRNCPIIAA